jgi:hypothetical protein
VVRFHVHYEQDAFWVYVDYLGVSSRLVVGRRCPT